MTLVEMLVALTATLLMMGLVAQLFSMMGQGVNGSRNIVEMADRMRSVQYSLRQDLSGATALNVLPPMRPEDNRGYFELIEGPDTDRITWALSTGGALATGTVPFWKDGYFQTTSGTFGSYRLGSTPSRLPLDAYITKMGSDDRLVGDVDDVLVFTTRAATDSFSGTLDASVGAASAIQSPYAEVAWFCTPMPATRNPRLYTLHRRQRLVMAHPGASPFVVPGDINLNASGTSIDGGHPNTAPLALRDNIDISCRVESGRIVPNTLGDLVKRENRFLHAAPFPHVFNWNPDTLRFNEDDPTTPDVIEPDARLLQGDRLGEDVVLTNVLAFDVRVADGAAIVKMVRMAGSALRAVDPGDAGYDLPNASDLGQRGAFVDLNWSAADRRDSRTEGLRGFTAAMPAAGELFKGRGFTVRNGATEDLLRRPTYDTWSTHYEYNGINDDGQSGPDQGTNGVDDDGNGSIDDPAETETRPPYPVRLNGIEVRIRCYEPTSRQIRQITIRHSL